MKRSKCVSRGLENRRYEPERVDGPDARPILEVEGFHEPAQRSADAHIRELKYPRGGIADVGASALRWTLLVRPRGGAHGVTRPTIALASWFRYSRLLRV